MERRFLIKNFKKGTSIRDKKISDELKELLQKAWMMKYIVVVNEDIKINFHDFLKKNIRKETPATSDTTRIRKEITRTKNPTRSWSQDSKSIY